MLPPAVKRSVRSGQTAQPPEVELVDAATNSDSQPVEVCRARVSELWHSRSPQTSNSRGPQLPRTFPRRRSAPQTWEIWGPERDESQVKSSLSSQRDSEASDLRDFVAAISSSASAKLEAQVGGVLSPWILSGRSNRVQGSSKNNESTLFSSSGFSMGSKPLETEFSRTPFSKTPFSRKSLAPALSAVPHQ